MVNAALLEEEIKAVGTTKIFLAKECGISRPTLDKWLNNLELMPIGMANKICDILRISDTDKKMAIFFAPNVQTNVNTE